MKAMYELMQKKMSKENAALLTALLALICAGVVTALVIAVFGLWHYADTIFSMVVLVCGLAVLVWILNL